VRLSPAIVAALLSAGCYGPGDFARQYAKAWCSNALPCGDVSVVFSGQDVSCEDFVRDRVVTTSQCMEAHCTFDPDAADACTDAVATETCGVDPSECEDVWVECDGGEGACSEP